MEILKKLSPAEEERKQAAETLSKEIEEYFDARSKKVSLEHPMRKDIYVEVNESVASIIEVLWKLGIAVAHWGSHQYRPDIVTLTFINPMEATRFLQIIAERDPDLYFFGIEAPEVGDFKYGEWDFIASPNDREDFAHGYPAITLQIIVHFPASNYDRVLAAMEKELAESL